MREWKQLWPRHLFRCNLSLERILWFLTMLYTMDLDVCWCKMEKWLCMLCDNSNLTRTTSCTIWNLQWLFFLWSLGDTNSMVRSATYSSVIRVWITCSLRKNWIWGSKDGRNSFNIVTLSLATHLEKANIVVKCNTPYPTWSPGPSYRMLHSLLEQLWSVTTKFNNLYVYW